MNSVEELLDVVGDRLGRERRSLAFQLREQSVHGIGDGGGKWKRRDGHCFIEIHPVLRPPTK